MAMLLDVCIVAATGSCNPVYFKSNLSNHYKETMSNRELSVPIITQLGLDNARYFIPGSNRELIGVQGQVINACGRTSHLAIDRLLVRQVPLVMGYREAQDLQAVNDP